MKYERDEWVPLDGRRLREARVARALSYDGLVARIKSRLTKGRLGQIERGGKPCRTGADVVGELARILRVSAAWLRGETVAPLTLGGWSEAVLRESPTGISLARWQFMARCVKAAKRDFDANREEDCLADWAVIERLVAWAFAGLTVDPVAELVPCAKQTESDAGRYIAYWTERLTPWFNGKARLNYYELANRVFPVASALHVSSPALSRISVVANSEPVVADAYSPGRLTEAIALINRYGRRRLSPELRRQMAEVTGAAIMGRPVRVPTPRKRLPRRMRE